MAVESSERPLVVLRRLHPVAATLARDCSRRTGKLVDLRLRFTRSLEDALRLLSRGEADVARFDPAAHALAVERLPGLSTLAVEAVDGRARSAGVVVVRRDSAIRRLTDLRGHSFAFGAETSAIGRFLAQNELLRCGITHAELSRFAFLDRHDRVFRAVEYGDFDAGVVSAETMARLDAEATALRVVHRLEGGPVAWVARPGLDPVIVDALRAELRTLRDAKALRVLGISGFVDSVDRDLISMRAAMVDARAFAECGPPAAGAPARPAPGRE